MTGDPLRVAFVCVRNAGRSQMAAAVAEREAAARDLADDVEVLTGGTRPADRVHPEVVETMADLDVDLSDREPREIATAELQTCDVVATMGCSTLDLDGEAGTAPANRAGSGGPDVRDWALDDPDGRDPATVRAIRDEVRRRVTALFDELDGDDGTER